MAGARIPQTQLDAMPLISPDQVGDPGVVTVVGNTLSRYWSQSVVQMPGPTALGGGAWRAISPTALDTRGCNRFVVLVTVSIGGNVGDNGAGGFFAGWCYTSAVNALAELPVVGGGTQTNYHHANNAVTIPNLALSLNSTTLFSIHMAGTTDNTSQGSGNGLLAIGTAVHLFISSATLPPAGQLYAFEIWGQG